MPRGMYDRSKARKKSKSKVAKGRKVQTAKAVKPEAPKLIAVLKANEAIMAFKSHAAGFHRQSLTLACSAAVCMIVGAHANGNSVTHEDMVTRLKKEVANRGNIQPAQVHKYIGLARMLVNHLLLRFKVGGPVHDVLRAKTPDIAIAALADYLTTQKVTTLEGLTVMFGRYRRTASKTKSGRASAGGGQAGNDNGSKNGGNGNGSKAPRIGGAPTLSPDAEREGLSTMLTSLPADFLVLTAVQAGHEPADIAVAAINLVATTAEAEHLKQVLDDRERHIVESIPKRGQVQARTRQRQKLAA